MKISCRILVTTCLLAGLFVSPAAFAQLRAYIKIPDIPGESRHVNHEGWIDLTSFTYPVIREASAQVGRGRARSRAEILPITMSKYGDAASVYINLATLQGKVFDEVVVEIVAYTGDASHVQFRYTFQNVTFTSYQSQMSSGENQVEESFSLNFERLRVLFIETGDDGSAGDEHEIEYDVVAGA